MLSNKTSRLKSGESKCILIYTASYTYDSYLYILEAEGYRKGTAYAKISLDTNPELDDYFNRGLEMAITETQKILVGAFTQCGMEPRAMKGIILFLTESEQERMVTELRKYSAPPPEQEVLDLALKIKKETLHKGQS